MAQPARQFYLPEHYLDLEGQAEDKSEYYNGEIFLMAGGSPAHSRVAVNLVGVVNTALSTTPCLIYNSDLRLGLKQKNFFTYPDATIVCGNLEYLAGRTDTITNPKIIFEVLSPSTENYDRGKKFVLYRGFETFQTYVLIDSTRVYVEVHQKLTARQWQMESYESLAEKLKIPGINLEIPLAEIYSRVEFSANQDRAVPQ